VAIAPCVPHESVRWALEAGAAARHGVISVIKDISKQQSPLPCSMLPYNSTAVPAKDR